MNIKTKQYNFPNSVGQIEHFEASTGYTSKKAEQQATKPKAVINTKKRRANNLLFGITVTTLTGIMAGAVFWAMHPNHVQETSKQSLQMLMKN